MRIVHFSDWHWQFEQLPEADLYVCTGDMYDDHPVRLTEASSQPFQSPSRYWGMSPSYSAQKQQAEAENLMAHGGFRQYTASPDAPFLLVRGNHDYAPLAPLFADCNVVHEFVANEVVSLAGFTFTGHRGIPWIYGTWQDETSRPDLLDRFRAMPRADVYVTHYPTELLDGVHNSHYGLEGALTEFQVRHRDDPDVSRLHLHGHVHECGGRTAVAGPVLVSNAARTYNVIEGSPAEGWREVPCP